MDSLSHDPEIHERALRLLATREHSREELRAKLARGGSVESDAIEAVLDALVREGSQSDQRFAEAWVRSRIERGHGPLRIRNDLLARGIEAGLAERALEAADCDWEAQLRRVHARKFGDTPPADERDLARRARFLAYRGFASGDIYRLLR